MKNKVYVLQKDRDVWVFAKWTTALTEYYRCLAQIERDGYDRLAYSDEYDGYRFHVMENENGYRRKVSVSEMNVID